MPRDAVWIVGASALQCAMLDQAHEMGLAVVMTDRDPDAPGAQLAERFYEVDTQSIAGHQALAKVLRPSGELRVRGVVTCGADCAPAVAAAAEVLGTPGISLAVAQLTHHKFDVRCALTGAGLDASQPAYRLTDLQEPWRRGARDAEAVQACGQLAEDIDWIMARVGPHQGIVVKPLEQCASRGVTVLPHGGEGLPDALATAGAYGRYALLEEGLTGTEHSAELIRDTAGHVLFWNIVDREFRYDDGIPLELGHINPTRLPLAAQWAIYDLLRAAADALGVTWGPFKLDLIQTAEGPKILEATARLSGGWDSQCTTPLSSGRQPMRLVLALACGRPVAQADGAWKRYRYAACAAILPIPGWVTDWDQAAIVEGETLIAEQIILHVRRGQRIPPYTDCATRPGFAICVRDTWEEAWEAAQRAARRIADAMLTTEEPPCPQS